MYHETRWTAQKIARRLPLLEPLVYRRRRALPPFRMKLVPADVQAPPVAPDVDDATWACVEPHTYWGEPLSDFVLRGTFAVPANWEADREVALYLPIGDAGSFSHPEALVYVDGEPFAACDRHHQEVLLPARWCDGASHALALHGWIGWLGARPGEQLRMEACAVVQIDAPTREFLAAARVALGIAQDLDPADPAHARLLSALDTAFRRLDLREPFDERFYASVPPALDVLRAGLDRAGPPLDVGIVATGHAHIDVAWLWPLAQTRRKTRRTFYTVMRLLEQFPDYHFTQSQPQLYDFVRQDDPDLFDAVRTRVAEGRWEPIGGMWVESDCNVSGPESLARQFLLGRTFFREHFGPAAESPVLWLPDVFGFAASLPQLVKLAGIDYFFTIKIGWNQYNPLPYDTFWWQGIDGSRLLAHASGAYDSGSGYASTYNANVEPAQVRGTWTTFKQKESRQDLFISFGYGDGGGGPTREMLENLREMRAFPATPRVRQAPAGDFFRQLEADVGDELPTWAGELYLEIHRGTYTTQARNKRANRKSEFLLHDAEFVAALASLLDPGHEYPAATFREAWRLVCLNQFHDILPGSSVGEVYADSQAQYAQVRELAESARDTALAAIARHVGGDLVLVNPTAFARDDPAFWPGQLDADEALVRADGTPVAAQSTGAGTWLAAGTLPPYSVTPLRKQTAAPLPPAPAQAVCCTEHAGGWLLENARLRVEIDAAGDVTRIFDKAHAREVLPPGAVANQLQAFEDRPLKWDAWDIDIFYDDQRWLAEPATAIAVTEAGPLRATLRVRRRVLNSEIEQHISLARNSARLDFETRIDWRERHVLLKVAFPVAVLAAEATYDIQWGNVTRTTHRNTSWDWARFEVAAQKWADLSEGDYGVSLLNDCKYGHDVRGNVLRLTLLRSPTSPDPEADQGEHRVTYSLLPHAGDWRIETESAAYALNDPVLVASGSARAELDVLPPLVAVDRDGIIIETIKRAEDGHGLLVRLYESHRTRGRVTLTAGFPLKAAWITNLLEENQVALEPDGDTVTLDFRPYQILNVRLVG